MTPSNDKQAGYSSFFATVASVCSRHPKSVLILLALITAQFIAKVHTSELIFDNSPEVFIDKDSADYKLLQELRRDFGSDLFFVILIEGDVFTKPFLENLQALHGELANLDFLHPESMVDGSDPLDPWGDAGGGSFVDEILSLVNARTLESRDDAIVVTPLFDAWTVRNDIEKFKNGVLQREGYVGRLVDRNGKFALINVQVDNDSVSQSAQMYRRVKGVVARYEQRGFEPYVLGPLALGGHITALSVADNNLVLGIAFILVLLACWYIFRNPSGVFGPALVLFLSLIWTVGTMSYLGLQPNVLTTALPALLFAVALGDSVHILSLYRDFHNQGVPRLEAIARAGGIAGMPLFFTSITTMVGLLSFQTARIEVVADMGLVAAIGIGYAFVLTLTLIPSLLNWSRPRRLRKDKGERIDAVDWVLQRTSRLAGVNWLPTDGPKRYGRSRTVFVGFLALLAFSGVGIAQLDVHHDPLTWLPEDDPIYVGTQKLDRFIVGASEIKVMIEPVGELGMRDIRMIEAMEGFIQEIGAYIHPTYQQRIIGDTQSLVDLLAESRRVLKPVGDTTDGLPATSAELTDLLFVLENTMPEQLFKFVTPDYEKGVILFRTKWLSATEYGGLQGHIASAVDKHLAGLAKVSPTGGVYMLVSTTANILYDLIRSFSIAILVIALMMIALLRDVKLGLTSLVPNVGPMILILGFMGFFGFKLNMSNIVFASIALGICVDDTIHFVYRIQQEMRSGRDIDAAIVASLQHSGRAIVITSFLLVAATSMNFVATIPIVALFGCLMAATVTFALLADLIAFPALLRLIYGTRPD